MNLATALIAPPTSEPVTLAEMKTHLKLPQSFTDDDSYITGLITAARVQCENDTASAFITQEWEQYFDHFPRSGFFPDRFAANYTSPHAHHHWFLRILRPPLQTVEFLKYIDTIGTLQTLDPSLYIVDAKSRPARVQPQYGSYWPPTYVVPNAVTLRIKCGYADTATQAIAADPRFQLAKTAIMQLGGHWYFNREPVVAGQAGTTPLGYERMLGPINYKEFY